MIPIVSDRSSHCKHHVCKKQRENRKCIWQRESRNKCIEEKREQCVCVLECVLECVYKEWRVLTEKISAPASVSWLQTSTVAPCLNYTPLLPHLGHSPAPPPHLAYSSTEQVLVCSRSANVWSLCSDWLKKPSNGYTFGRRNKNSTGCVLRWCHFIVFLQSVNVHVSWGGAV